jgi:hypothetical protein
MVSVAIWSMSAAVAFMHRLKGRDRRADERNQSCRVWDFGPYVPAPSAALTRVTAAKEQ